MAALDFPASPTNGQVFVGGNGVTYTWNGTIWLASSMASQASDTPPANPTANQLWFNSTLGQLFIYYTDANSSQWVPANPSPSGVPVGGGIIREVNVTTPAATIDLFSLGVKSVQLIFYIQPVTDNVTMYLRTATGATVNVANNCYTITAFTGGSPVAASVGSLGPVPSFEIGNTCSNAGNGGVSGTLVIPNIAAVKATGQVTWNTSPSTFAYLATKTFIGSGGDGFDLRFSTGNIAAGSFVRVIGWQ